MAINAPVLELLLKSAALTDGAKRLACLGYPDMLVTEAQFKQLCGADILERVKFRDDSDSILRWHGLAGHMTRMVESQSLFAALGITTDFLDIRASRGFEIVTDLNQPLATAYYLKEDLRQLWTMKNKKTAKAFLADWILRARASGIDILEKFATTLERHAAGILAYYDYPISTGPLEGTNNKIRTMQRQAYGFRDHEFFKLKILGIHETKYALVG